MPVVQSERSPILTRAEDPCLVGLVCFQGVRILADLAIPIHGIGQESLGATIVSAPGNRGEQTLPEDGYSRESLWGDHTNHYDSTGKKIGESRKSLFGDHTNQFDASGHKVGESRDSLWGDHTNHYDASGRKVGESRDSLWGDHTNHYDASGHKVGESRDSLWGDQTNHVGSWQPGNRSDDLLSSHPGPGSVTDWNDHTSVDYLGGLGSSGFSGNYVSSGPRRQSRGGSLLLYLVLLVGGTVLSIGVILALVLVLSILKGVPGVANLTAALTYQTAFGILLPASWIIAMVVGAVVSQIFFTPLGTRDLDFGMYGLLAGCVALLGLGLAGWADGWGAVLPAIGALVGISVGAFTDWQGSASESGSGMNAATSSKSPLRAWIITAAVIAIAGIVGHQLWIHATSASTSATSRESAPALAKGDWVLVLVSMSKKSTSREQALDRAAALDRMSPTAVVDTDRFKGLNDGYWAVIAARTFKSRKSATNACADFNLDSGANCYPRQIG